MQLAELGSVGDQLGRPGGQGSVYRLDGASGLLVKLYHPQMWPHINVRGLEAIVGWRSGLSAHEIEVVDNHTAWPRAVVEHRGQVGVVLAEAPGSFMHRVDGGRRLRDLQWAYCRDGARFAGDDVPPVQHRLLVALGIAALMELLHLRGVVLGDLSHSNVAWAPHYRAGGPLPVFLIDCDSTWVLRAPRGLPRADTPQWSDPRTAGAPDEPHTAMSSDIFRLGLAVMRLIYAQNVGVDTDTDELRLPRSPVITGELAECLGASLHRSASRPTATTWVKALLGQVALVQSSARRHR